MNSRYVRAALVVLAIGLAGCTDPSFENVAPKSTKGLPAHVVKAMNEKGMTRSSPVMARIFKEEGAFEVWKQKSNGRYDLIATYSICKWSGQLGPKYIEGDRQAPEGFYTVRPGHMNPNSNYHLSFNIGFPNAFDRAHGRTGAHLMVHGDCSSSGCYSMSNGPMEEIYAFARESFAGGQTEFQIQAFPFRMTAANMERYKNDPNIAFWRNLKQGYDAFERTRVPPKVDVCEKRYVFNAATTPASPTAACPAGASASLVSAYESTADAATPIPASSSGTRPLSDSIGGISEAKLVAEWTKKRARGERVPVEPPKLNDDGSVSVTARMGRIDSEAGRRMAAREAAEAEKKRAEEEKKQAAEQRRIEAAMAKAEKAAAEKAAEVAVQAEAAPPAEPERKGILGGVGKRLGNLFGS